MFWMRAFALAWPAPDSTPTGSVHTEVAPRESTVDAFVERYVDWREQCEVLDSAYRGWARATGSERDMAFAMYRAALDREEMTARDYELAAARLEDSPRG
jgi:hypothetical protein